MSTDSVESSIGEEDASSSDPSSEGCPSVEEITDIKDEVMSDVKEEEEEEEKMPRKECKVSYVKRSPNQDKLVRRISQVDSKFGIKFKRIKRRHRAPNWKGAEIGMLLHYSLKDKLYLRSEKQGGLGSEREEMAAWQRVADRVNDVSIHKRTAKECKDKLRYFLSDARIKNAKLIRKYGKNGARKVPDCEKLTGLERLALEFGGIPAIAHTSGSKHTTIAEYFSPVGVTPTRSVCSEEQKRRDNDIMNKDSEECEDSDVENKEQYDEVTPTSSDDGQDQSDSQAEKVSSRQSSTLAISREGSDSESGGSRSDSGSGSDDDSGPGEFQDAYGEDVVGDEEDRKHLELMTEKEREQEIFNRLEKRAAMRTSFEIEKKKEQKKKVEKERSSKTPSDPDISKVSATQRIQDRIKVMESKKQETKKMSALENLKARQEEKKKAAGDATDNEGSDLESIPKLGMTDIDSSISTVDDNTGDKMDSKVSSIDTTPIGLNPEKKLTSNLEAAIGQSSSDSRARDQVLALHLLKKCHTAFRTLADLSHETDLMKDVALTLNKELMKLSQRRSQQGSSVATACPPANVAPGTKSRRNVAIQTEQVDTACPPTDVAPENKKRDVVDVAIQTDANDLLDSAKIPTTASRSRTTGCAFAKEKTLQKHSSPPEKSRRGLKTCRTYKNVKYVTRNPVKASNDGPMKKRFVPLLKKHYRSRCRLTTCQLCGKNGPNVNNRSNNVKDVGPTDESGGASKKERNKSRSTTRKISAKNGPNLNTNSNNVKEVMPTDESGVTVDVTAPSTGSAVLSKDGSVTVSLKKNNSKLALRLVPAKTRGLPEKVPNLMKLVAHVPKRIE